MYVLRCAASSRHVDWMRFRSDGGHFMPSFLGVTGLNSLIAGEPRLSSSRFTADVGVSFILYMPRRSNWARLRAPGLLVCGREYVCGRPRLAPYQLV